MKETPSTQFVGGPYDGDYWGYPKGVEDYILLRAWRDSAKVDMVVVRYEWQENKLVYVGVEHPKGEEQWARKTAASPKST